MVVVTFLPVAGMVLFYFLGEKYKEEDQTGDD
jgi:hypothetical protein